MLPCKAISHQKENIILNSFSGPSHAPAIERLPKRERVVHPARILSSALVILAIVFAALYGRVQIAQLNVSINEATDYLSELTSEKVRMEAELDGQMSLAQVEEIATEELGMVKPDNSQVTYLKVEQKMSSRHLKKIRRWWIFWWNFWKGLELIS